MEILAAIKKILAKNLDIDPEAVNEGSTFDSLGIDSLDQVELICDLEEELEIDLGEPDGITTVQGLVEYIEKL